MSFYLSNDPEKVPIWWTDLYASFIEGEKPKNEAHFAAFVISNQNLCYVVSMGKTHFYLKEYCDVDFGINLAERIAVGDLKLKNSQLFGGKKNKSIVSYQDNSLLEYDSGESILFIKAEPNDEVKWGKVASFGNSVQFHLDIIPDELPKIIKNIEDELQKEPNIKIPRAKIITDPVVISELNLKLYSSIIGSSSGAVVQAAEATVSGVDFIFLQGKEYKFIYNRQRFEIEGELNIESLLKFCHDNNVDLATEMDKIKVKVINENNSGYIKPVKYFLDFVDDQRHVLLDGNWYVFNENYMDYLKEQVDDIAFEIGKENFSKNVFEAYKASISEEERKKTYGEKYFNELREKEGYLNKDRNIQKFQGYKIEMMDLYKDETAFFVKIGTSQPFLHAIDQSMAAIKIFQNDIEKTVNEISIKPKKLCLWLIVDRKKELNKISEINSLIFLIKLAEWKRQCMNAGFSPIIRIGYKTD